MAGSATGHFETRGDRDTFRVRFEAGKTYELSSGNGGPILTLQLPDGTAFAPPIFSANYVTFVAPVTGDYWVTAKDYGASQVYVVTATELNDVTPASISTPMAMNVGETKSVYWNPENGDDWYAVNLVAGQSYLFKSSGLGDDLYLADSSGKVVTVQDDQLHFTATQTGTYYAGVHVFGGDSYTLSLESVADDRGEVAASAGTLAVGALASGVWETGNDSDWYAITLTAGESYRFALSTVNAPSRTTTIYDAAGTPLATSMIGRIDGLLIFAPETTGTYYVSASAGSDFYNPNGNWNYSLGAIQLTGDLTDNALTTGVLSIGTPTASSWQGVGDADWFAVALSAGQAYEFALTSTFSPLNMALYDSSGNEVSRAFGSPIMSLVQTVTTAGIYYLGVVGGIEANYTVTANTFVDDFANNSTTSGALTVGGMATGRFEVALDSDWFAVQLEAGKSYRFSTDPYTASQIRDAQGNLLTKASNDDRHFSPATSGTYYLEVLGDIGDYSVSIVQAGDDFREDMLTHGVIRNAVTGNDADEVFISTEDHDLFWGQGGNDRFVAGAGYDAFVGGAGIDTVDFGRFASGVTVSLRTGRLNENGVLRVGFSSIENIEGSSHGDMIEGDALANALYGKGGNDTLTGLAGDDAIDGGAGTDRAVFSGNRADYRIAMEGQGYRVTDLRTGTNDGSDFLTNIEVLAFADGEVIPLPPPGTDTDFRLVALTGFVGGVSGYGTVFGTNGFQDVTVLDGPASIAFDASFARGGDVLRLPGNAGDYSVSLSGSNARLIAEDFAISIPVGTMGLAIMFADGVRTLVYDAGLGSVRIGAQAITGVTQITAAPDGTVLPGEGDPSVAGRLILFPDLGAPVVAAGKVNVFGTNGSDEVTLDKGSFVLDGSFGRGGDMIHLLDPASGFKAYTAGSNLILTSSDARITIPVGLNATALDFAGNMLGLRYDVAMGVVRIGDQSITATSLETADPLDASTLALAAQSFA